MCPNDQKKRFGSISEVQNCSLRKCARAHHDSTNIFFKIRENFFSRAALSLAELLWFSRHTRVYRVLIACSTLLSTLYLPRLSL